MDAHARRRDTVVAGLAPAGLDAILISNPINVTYLTGFTGEASPLILSRDRVLLVSDGRFAQQLADECPGLPTHIRPADRLTSEVLAECIDRLGSRAVGFESHHVTVADHDALKTKVPAADFKPTSNVVETLRQVKDAGEVAAIRRAVAVAEAAFADFLAALRPSDTEKDLHDRMESLVRREGGTRTAFPTIAAIGPRAALPHAPPTSIAVHSADFLLLDWGAVVDGYHSDLTRMVWTADDRNIESRLRAVYTSVKRAQRRAIGMIRPGVAVRELDAAVRAELAKDDLANRFTHGLGHGIGLQIHEAPFMRANSEVTLAAGMVITVEPGVYLPGWGGVRIEDDVLVTADGAEVLTAVGGLDEEG